MTSRKPLQIITESKLNGSKSFEIYTDTELIGSSTNKNKSQGKSDKLEHTLSHDQYVSLLATSKLQNILITKLQQENALLKLQLHNNNNNNNNLIVQPDNFIAIGHQEYKKVSDPVIHVSNVIVNESFMQPLINLEERGSTPLKRVRVDSHDLSSPNLTFPVDYVSKPAIKSSIVKMDIDNSNKPCDLIQYEKDTIPSPVMIHEKSLRDVATKPLSLLYPNSVINMDKSHNINLCEGEESNSFERVSMGTSNLSGVYPDISVQRKPISSTNSAFTQVKSGMSFADRVKLAKASSVKTLFRNVVPSSPFTPIQQQLREYQRESSSTDGESNSQPSLSAIGDQGPQGILVPLSELSFVKTKLSDWKDTYSKGQDVTNV